MTGKELTSLTRGRVMKDVAKELGISPSALSMCRKGTRTISAALEEKVLRIYKKGIPQPEEIAQECPDMGIPTSEPKTGTSRALKESEAKVREKNAIIEAKDKIIAHLQEALSKSITFDEYCDMEEDLVRRSKWQLNSWARHKSAGDWVDSPMNINGVDYPALTPPVPYRLKGEPEIVPADQRPEGEWTPA